jgi:hypothetical protein
MTDSAPDELTPSDPPPDEPPASGRFTKKRRPVKQDTKPAGSAPRGRQSANSKRKEKLLTLFGTIGSGVLMFEQFDGMTILQGSEQLAQATADLADQVPAVAKAIDAMSVGGAYGAFILALMSIALPIAAHHNVIPEQITHFLVPRESNAQ